MNNDDTFFLLLQEMQTASLNREQILSTFNGLLAEGINIGNQYYIFIKKDKYGAVIRLFTSSLFLMSASKISLVDTSCAFKSSTSPDDPSFKLASS